MELVSQAIERTSGATRIARHRHAGPYAALVLAGGYVESGDRGRFRVGPGDVLFHGAFEAHQDAFDARPAELLNLPLDVAPDIGSARVSDADAIARLAERDPHGAGLRLLEQLLPGPNRLADWPDRLAAALAADRVERIENWADRNGLAPETVSRGFRAAYGISPRGFRLEQRARRAAVALAGSGECCASIAIACGFSDQAHMTRTIRALYGKTPSGLRAA
ncbi:MAG: AraC family transcriptional regulator [Parasphingopyxis sp.]|uniref:helix-turn-helix domain-containing protein n=1 Tax=Parasphingopyxis sp. TaxID=1920299 RepID=UPI0032ED5286